MTEVSQTSITGKIGVNAFKSLIEAKGSLYHIIAQENDLGIDARIEICQNRKPIGVSFFVQVKSGTSYFRNGKGYIQSDKRHFEYWDTAIVPVIGILYDTKTEKLYWVNISKHLKSLDKVENYNIFINLENDLNSSNYQDFIDYIIAYNNEYKKYNSFQERLEWLFDENTEKALAGLSALFTHHKNEKIFWLTILNHIYLCDNLHVLDGITYFLSFVLGDIVSDFKNHGGSIDPKIKEWLKSKFAEIIDAKILTKIFSVINEEEGVGRGTIGFYILWMLEKIPSIELHLKDIFFDRNIPVFSRDIALMLYIHIQEPKDALEFLERQLIYTNEDQLFLPVNNTNNLAELKNEIFAYKDYIEEYGYFDIFL